MVQHMVLVGLHGNVAMDINTDPGCGRTLDPDMASSSGSSLMSTWPQVAIQATLICMVLQQYDPWVPTLSHVLDGSTGICIAFIGNPNHGHRHRPWQ